VQTDAQGFYRQLAGQLLKAADGYHFRAQVTLLPTASA
jgi:hypothetical protein